MSWISAASRSPTPSRRGRVRPLPPAVVHLAHLHTRAGRRARFQRRDARSARDRAALEGHVRHRAARRRPGQAHGRPRRARAGGLTGSLISDGLAARAGEPQDAARDRRDAPRSTAAPTRLASLGRDQVADRHRPRHRNARAVARRPPRAARGREGADAPQRRAGPAAPGAALGARREGLPLRDDGRRRRRSPTSSAAARSCSSTTSCSGPTTPAAARRARRSPTASTDRSSTSSNHDVAMVAVSRAPLAALEAYKRRMGWTFPWASSQDSDFNYDFNVSVTEEQQRPGGGEYNYRDVDTTMARAVDARRHGRPASRRWPAPTPPTYTREAPGMSAFAFEDGVVYHTYSAYARGLDGLWGMYQWLDRAPKGRNERRRRGGAGTTSTARSRVAARRCCRPRRPSRRRPGAASPPRP